MSNDSIFWTDVGKFGISDLFNTNTFKPVARIMRLDDGWTVSRFNGKKTPRLYCRASDETEARRIAEAMI